MHVLIMQNTFPILQFSCKKAAKPLAARLPGIVNFKKRLQDGNYIPL